ncbi:hypothetical protein F4678DRAFT_114124 [Xylaria arbuscula]|nr:hypothetical protein F4678DRAFT_114124 [Xylaria arbuscula]
MEENEQNTQPVNTTGTETVINPPSPPPQPSITTTHHSAPNRAEIAVPPPSAADDKAFITALTALVNKVYSQAERGIYRTDFERTSTEDVAELLRAGEVAVAYLPPPDADAAVAANSNEDSEVSAQPIPIGCIAMKQVGPSTGEFGMLAVDPSQRGAGIGGDLVRFAETWCLRRLEQGTTATGNTVTIQLELLAPVHFVHAGKTALQAWYERLGYARVELRDFRAVYPRLFELLSGPSEFRVFEKRLC